MTLHQRHHELRCHHCGHVERPPSNCPQCAKVDLRPVGAGTERAEERLGILFPDYPVLRIDRDSTARKGAMEQLFGTINFNAPPLWFTYSGAAGEPLMNGKSQTLYQSTSDLHLAGTQNAITYGASGLRDEWYMAISPRFDSVLAVGNYPVSRVHSATRLGVYLTKNGVECETVSGSINIRALTFDEIGQADGLNAALNLYCNGSVVPFKGTIRHKL